MAEFNNTTVVKIYNFKGQHAFKFEEKESWKRLVLRFITNCITS